MDKLKDTSFLAGKAGSFSGVPLRTVQSWVEKGLLTPDIADTTGTGSKRLFSVWNCIEIGIIKSLADSRISMKLIKEIIKEIMDFLRTKWNIPDGLSVPAGETTPLKLLVKGERAKLIVRLSDKPSFRFVSSDNPKEFQKDFDKILEGYDTALIVNIKNIADRVISVIG